jgi:hypothetical protein
MNIQLLIRSPVYAVPTRILDSSISQLSILASALVEEMGSAAPSAQGASPEARACREILLTVSVLIPKLQAAKHLLPGESVGRCSACQDE